ncbi:hypothetical protein FRX31_020427 [Thalictrum thalictroides]|uniref:Uncharacterized protein n=1 Tax=Thalictrum thalictroides TaxID=46969 RepID=A0A7J6VXX8_THATH|nr:hypothetical protein FRX31_020427 [Thalictrum thalictroides]
MGCPSTLAVWKNVLGERDEVIQLLQDQQDAMVVLKQWPKLQEGFSVEAAMMRIKATLRAWLAMLPESLKDRSKRNFISLARNWQAVLEPG